MPKAIRDMDIGYPGTSVPNFTGIPMATPPPHGAPSSRDAFLPGVGPPVATDPTWPRGLNTNAPGREDQNPADWRRGPGGGGRKISGGRR